MLLSYRWSVIVLARERVQTSIRFSEEMLLKITYIAKKNRRSLNAQVEYLAQQCIDSWETEKGSILLSEEDWLWYR